MKTFITLILLLGFSFLVYATSSSAPPEPVQTPEQKAMKDAADAKWVTQVLLVRALRKSMKNPDSFNLEEAIELNDGTLCLTYRATNSFNAVIPGQAILSLTGAVTSDDKGRFAARWNATCAKRPGRDITYIRRAL